MYLEYGVNSDVKTTINSKRGCAVSSSVHEELAALLRLSSACAWVSGRPLDRSSDTLKRYFVWPMLF